MFIRQHAKTMAVSLTLCFAVNNLASMTAQCAEQQADRARLSDAASELR